MFASVTYARRQSWYRTLRWGYTSVLPLERVFTDFIGHLVCTKRRNQVILVLKDSFSKFVAFYPVHNITSAIVCDILESQYCLSLLFQTMPRFSGRRNFMIFAFNGGLRELVLHHTTTRVLLYRGLIAI